MKNNTIIIIILIPLLLFAACSNGQENNDPLSSLESLCIESAMETELTEGVPAIVKVVEEGQPFFNGNKKYYEVDIETNIPELFELYKEKIIRVFPTRKMNSDVGEEVFIKGKIFSCLSGNHGLLTNDFKGFTLIND